MVDPNNRIISDLWSVARDRLGEDDRRQCEPSGGTGFDIVKNLQSLNEEAIKESIDKRWRITVPGRAGKTIIIRDLLGKITKWLYIFAKVGDAAIQYDPTHAALPWAGVAINDFENFGFILEGIELIAREIGRCAILESLYVDGVYQTKDSLRDCLLELYTTILVYLCRAQRYYRQNTFKRMAKGALITRDKFEELLMSIKSSQSAVDRCSNLINAEVNKEIARSLRGLDLAGQNNHQRLLALWQKVDEPISRISRSLALIEDSLEKSKRREILDWVSNQPYTSYHHQVSSSVLPGTGQWLLHDSDFVFWQQESASSLLWLHGSPGTGKSKLVSIIIEDALRNFKNGLASLPAYYYCSQNAAEPERSDPNVILASIARQLACQQPGSPSLPPVVESFEDARLTGSSRKTFSLDESHELILRLLEYHDMTIIVIDALDECDIKKRSDLLWALHKITEDSQCLVKILVSSRDDGDIKGQLQDFPNLTIESRRNFGDISAFVRFETDRLIERGRLLRNSKAKENLRTLIVEEVTEKAEGMFRWASMQLEYLCGAVLDEDLQEMLGRLPLELSDLYSQIYDQMLAGQGPASVTIIQNALRWLLSSKTRLRSFEFRKAISINTNISLDRLSNDHILELLHNFLVLDRDLDTFRFAHLSVAEYLQESRREYGRELCHAFAAEVCLIEMIGPSSCTDVGKLLHGLGLDFPATAPAALSTFAEGLPNYALTNWAFHAARAGEAMRTANGRFKDVFHFFLFHNCGETSPFSTWLRFCERRFVVTSTLFDFLSHRSVTRTRPYFFACAYGFCEIVRRSMTDSGFVASTRRDGLFLAAFHGQESVIRLLLNTDEIQEATMIELARHSSLETLTRVFESTPKTKITAKIVLAASRREAEIMTLLLDYSKDLTITTEIIEDFTCTSSVSVLKVLLDHAKNCEITAACLSGAAHCGDLAAVELRLDSGGHRYITSEVLGQAARSGNVDILRLLLDQTKGPEIDEEAIFLAARCYSSSGGETMRIMLESGGRLTQHAVLEAARCGNHQVLEVLLDEGGKLTAQVMREAATNANTMKALLERVDSKSMLVDAFSKMMVEAVENILSGPEIVKILLEQETCRGIKILEDVLLKINVFGGNLILTQLLGDGRDIDITEKALERTLESLDFDRTIQMLLERADVLGITQGMLAVAARNPQRGDKMLRLLLSRPNTPPVVEEVVKAVVANEKVGLEMIKFLENHYGQLDITDEVVKNCAAHGKLATIEYIVAQYTVPEISQEAFECCSRTGQRDVAKYILERNETISITQDCIDMAGGNPRDDYHMVRFLLERWPDGKITDETLKRALQHPPFDVKSLLRRGGIIHLSADVLMTALHFRQYAAFSSFIDAVPEIEISETLLEAAARKGQKQLGFLLRRNTQTPITERILKAAASNSSLGRKTLNVLLSSKGAREIITEEVQTTAALCGNLKFFKAISQVEGIASTKINWEEVAHLHVAVQRGDTAAVSRLLQAPSTEVDMLDLSGRTLLSVAAEKGHDEVVKLLLEADADPNSKASADASHEDSPLFWAVREGHHDVVEILMDAGAEVNVVDSGGQSPIDYVRKWQCPCMEKLLMRKRSPGE